MPLSRQQTVHSIKGRKAYAAIYKGGQLQSEVTCEDTFAVFSPVLGPERADDKSLALSFGSHVGSQQTVCVCRAETCPAGNADLISRSLGGGVDRTVRIERRM